MPQGRLDFSQLKPRDIIIAESEMSWSWLVTKNLWNLGPKNLYRVDSCEAVGRLANGELNHALTWVFRESQDNIKVVYRDGKCVWRRP